MSASEPDPPEPDASEDAPTKEQKAATPAADDAPTKVQEAAAQVKHARHEPDDPSRSSKGRRWGVRIILVLAVIIGVVGTLAVWVNRQALNAENWSNTSSSLLENKDIREQLSVYIVDQVYANVDVSNELKTLLPGDLKQLSGPAAGALRSAAEDATNLLLEQPLVQNAWKASNKVAMQQLINVIEEKKQGVVETSNGTISINIRPIVQEAVNRIGLPSTLADKIPADAGQFTVLQSDDIAAVQSYGKALRGLAVVLPVLTLLLFLLAVWLARGRRRHTLLLVGVDIIIIGAIVLVARVIGQRQAVDALATTDSVRPAVEASLTISTKMLKEIGWSLVLTGIPVILAAVLAGPLRPAVASRRFLAPWLRDQRGVVYAVVALIGIVLIVWQPVPWTGQPIPVIIAIILAVIGIELLRRQTNAEFPETERSDAVDAIRAWRGRAKDKVQSGTASVSASVSSRREQWAADRAEQASSEAPKEVSTPAPPPPAAPPAASASSPAVAPTTDHDTRIAQLERLAALHEKGILSDEELADQKRRVLDSEA